MKIDALVEEIAERIAECVVARIGNTIKTVYTTAQRGPWAPGKSRSWMLRNIKTMPGARRAGRDWVIDSADYDRWCTARDAASFRKPTHVFSSKSDEELADRYLAEAGFRPTKGLVTIPGNRYKTTFVQPPTHYDAALKNVQRLDAKVAEAARRLGEAIELRDEALAALVQLKDGSQGTTTTK